MKRLAIVAAPELEFVFEELPTGLLSRIASFLDYFVASLPTPSASPLRIRGGLETEPEDGWTPIDERFGVGSFSHGERIAFVLPDARVECDPSAGLARVRLARDSADSLDRFVTQLLPPLLFELAQARGWIGLHAAAIARRGIGALLCGPSGSGKTTLFRAAAEAGWELLSDDLVWLRAEEDSRPVLRPFPRGAPLAPLPAPTVAEAELRWIGFPEVLPGERTALAALDPGASLIRLLAQAGGLAGGTLAGRRFRSLVRLSAQPAFCLTLGDDSPAAALELIERRMAESA